MKKLLTLLFLSISISVNAQSWGYQTADLYDEFPPNRFHVIAELDGTTRYSVFQVVDTSEIIFYGKKLTMFGNTFAPSDFDKLKFLTDSNDTSDFTNFRYAYEHINDHTLAGYVTNSTFDILFAAKTTSDLGEGTNLYWTNSRFDVRLSSKTTSDITEGANLYFTSARARLSISAGNGVTYNNLTGVISNTKRVETYSGVSNVNGEYSVTFSQAYSVAPNIQASIVNQSATNQFIKITSVSTTGFIINVYERGSVNISGSDVLLSGVSNVNGASIDVLCTEK